MGLQDSNTTDDFDNTQVVIRGGTDNTKIGNVGDRLKVDANTNPSAAELASFIIQGSEIQIGNNKSMLSIVNTTGSTVKIKIRQIKMVNSKNTSVTGVVANFEFHKFVSHSAGTSLTPIAFDSADTLSGSVTVRTGATIVSEGAVITHYEFSTDEWGAGAIDVESNDHAIQTHGAIYTTPRFCKPITLNANEGFHIKQVVNSTVGTFDIEMIFTQE